MMGSQNDLIFAPRLIDVDGISLNTVQAGSTGSPAVIFLHGFPEMALGFRAYIGPFVQAGFQVIIPDQRGYNLSSKPTTIKAYRLDSLASDIFRLADRIGCDRFALVGHDWGASVAWSMVTAQPARITRMAVINGPHPAVWFQAMRFNPEQRRKSRYVQLLRVPRLPEWLIKLGRYKGLSGAFTDASGIEILSPDILHEYRVAWRRKNALTGMLNWYRANLGQDTPVPAASEVSTPTLILWGDRDAYACSDLADQSAALCNKARVVHYPRAGHWLLHEEQSAVCEELLRWLT